MKQSTTKKATAKRARTVDAPSAASLREMPEIDFRRYRVRRNPFAKRIAAEGIERAHDEPSAESLAAIPEMDLRRAKRHNPYAEKIRTGGYTLQIGRSRPRAGEEIGPTITKSVRLPPEMWGRLEQRARVEGIALHALVRAALAALLEDKPPSKRRKTA